VDQPRLYTVAEANALLPELTRLLEEMRLYGQQLAAVQARQAQTTQKIKRNGHHNPTEDATVAGLATQLDESLRGGISRLAEWNIQLKDLATGLVDFPALRQDRTVFLCWQLGESEVAFWHETDTGFAGRQPLDDLIP
jgi:hypothetical protein